MKRQELLEIETQHIFWRRLAALTGWRLHGFSGFQVADFITSQEVKPSGIPICDAVVLPLTSRHQMITVTGDQRDALVTAIMTGGAK